MLNMLVLMLTLKHCFGIISIIFLKRYGNEVSMFCRRSQMHFHCRCVESQKIRQSTWRDEWIAFRSSVNADAVGNMEILQVVSSASTQ